MLDGYGLQADTRTSAAAERNGGLRPEGQNCLMHVIEAMNTNKLI